MINPEAIFIKTDRTIIYRCSNCGSSFDTFGVTNYCSSCGHRQNKLVERKLDIKNAIRYFDLDRDGKRVFIKSINDFINDKFPKEKQEGGMPWDWEE